MLPKPLREYYGKTFINHDYTPSKKDKLVEFSKKILEFFFPNRVAETFSENRARKWSFLDGITIQRLLAGDLRYLQINKKEHKQLNKLSYWDQVEYALRLEKEGRVKDVKLSNADKEMIERNYLDPYGIITKFAKQGKLWSKPTIIVDKRAMNLHKEIHEEMAQQKLNNAKDVFVKTTQPPTQK